MSGPEPPADPPAPRPPPPAGPPHSPVRIRQAAGPADLAAVRRLFEAYVAWLDEDISFQDYAAELAALPGKYAPPSGALLLAVDDDDGDDDGQDGRVLGCIALRPLRLAPDLRGGRGPDARVCEMKRLFVCPEARGRRVASALVGRAVVLAREAGYDEMVLDTLARMAPALRLYESEGFVETQPYYHNPLPGVVYLAMKLDPPAANLPPAET